MGEHLFLPQSWFMLAQAGPEAMGIILFIYIEREIFKLDFIA